ncbi:MAG: zinc-ribbon domain-containing protein [Eubacterium sp.]|nr:zinc-ribbon domain-containing protein [Eubacterium sp.]
MKYCKNCGQALDDSHDFCPNCGTKSTFKTEGTSTTEANAPGAVEKSKAPLIIGISAGAAVLIVVCTLLVVILGGSNNNGSQGEQLASNPTPASVEPTPSETPETTETPTATPEPTAKPTPTPVPHSTYVNGKKFRTLDAIVQYLKKQGIDGEKIEICTLKIKTATGKKKVYQITGWMGRYTNEGTYVYVKEGGMYHLYLQPAGTINLMTKGGEYILAGSYVGAGCGGYTIYKYSKKNRCYKEVCSDTYQNDLSNESEQSDADRVFEELCDKAGIDSDDLKDPKTHFVKEISLM